MKTVTLTVRVSPEVKERLEQLAKATERTQAFLAEQAIEEFLDAQAWQVRAIEEGLQAAERGQLASQQDVRDSFSKWGVHGNR